MSKESCIWAVVPVKSFGRAKGRLAPLLGARERRELARTMLGDVLSALRQVKQLAGILVVSGDPEAMEIARAHDAHTIDDPHEHGTNAAIRLAVAVLRGRGAEAMIVVPSDVPQIEADELQPLLQALRSASIVLAPAACDGGTNFLGCAPIDAVAPCFGPDSFRKHVAAAKQAGIIPLVFPLASLARDIDRPDDLQNYRARHPTRTEAFLTRVLGPDEAFHQAAVLVQ